MFFACSPKTSTKVVKTTPVKESQEVKPMAHNETEGEGKDVMKTTPPIRPAFVSASVQKTPCFGKCPSFKITFDAKGYATYEGKKNVDRMGSWRAKIGGKECTAILAEAQKIGYFNMPKTCPANGKFIADLPFTITTLEFGGQKHQIRNNVDAPQELINYENYLIELAETLDWKETGDQ